MESREATTSPAVNQNGMNNTHNFDHLFQLNPPPPGLPPPGLPPPGFELQAPPPAGSRAVRNSPVTNVVAFYF